MAKRKRVVGVRTTRIKARKLEMDFLRSRARKPFKTSVKKKGKKFVVKVQERK